MLNEWEEKLLREARELLRKKQVRYVCMALDDAEDILGRDSLNCAEFALARVRLQKYIRAQIAPCSYLSAWQSCVIGISRTTPDKLRQDRIDWISWMLGEL
jgi:hypothetical protein